MHRYLQYLKEVEGRDEASLDAVAKAIDRFEDHAKNRDFKKFHVEQARAFKAHLASTRNARTGDPLSASTVHSTLAALKGFFGSTTRNWSAPPRPRNDNGREVNEPVETPAPEGPASPPAFEDDEPSG